MIVVSAAFALLSFTLGATLAHMVPMLGALGFGSAAAVIGSLFGLAQVLILALGGQSEEDDGDVVADPAASDAETFLVEAEPQAPEKRRAMKEDTQRSRRRDDAGGIECARSHVEFKPSRVAMPCDDIGSMCGHLIANRGKSGHVISIYPDAIPMSRLSIPVSETAILCKRRLFFAREAHRERHSCQRTTGWVQDCQHSGTAWTRGRMALL